MKPRVYITRRLPQPVLSKIAQKADIECFEGEDRPVPRDELLQSVQGAHGILSMITEKMDAEVFASAGPQLRIVANMAVGYDNIVLDDARRLGIMVTNTPDVLTQTTADLVFALLLATARRIVEAERFLRDGRWKTWAPMLLTGLDVYGATLGIIGMGRIGEAVVCRTGGFNMKVIYHNRNRRPEIEKKYGCAYCSLDEVLCNSDFVVPLTPLTEETKGLIGERELSLMKTTGILINVSRGQIVDEKALYQALKRRQIWGAGLDVFEQEPIWQDNPLLALDNVVLLPHIGSASIQTRMKMAGLAAENLLQGITGKEPPNRVI